jgi:hypothetical protein
MKRLLITLWLGLLTPLSVTALSASPTSQPSAASAATDVSPPASVALLTPRATLAVVDFFGPDREMGRFLADTIQTALGQSEQLQLRECAEVRKFLAELKLEGTEPLDADQARRLGQRIGVTCLLIGTYLHRDGPLTINARLLDTRSGDPMPGGAHSVAGSPQELLSLARALASEFHRQMTGKELVFQPAARTDRPLVTEAMPEPYSGLIVDARELPLQRAIGPRILDEEGRVLYPDPLHLPDPETLQDQGLAAYLSKPEQALRSGRRPLLVQAVGVSGIAREDLVVSRDTARLILQEDQQGKFRWRWAISILVGPK